MALDCAGRYPNLKLQLADADFCMASFWQVVAEGSPEKLQRLEEMVYRTPTVETFQTLQPERLKLVGQSCEDSVWAAYLAILFNRTAFSGIASSGPIGGVGQKSKWTIDCRYNAQRLVESIRKVSGLLRDRTEVVWAGFDSFLPTLSPLDTLVYLDPPYFEKGDALYPAQMTPQAHEGLARILTQARYPWVLSYDDHPTIQELYRNCLTHPIDARYSIDGVKSAWKKTGELIITSGC